MLTWQRLTAFSKLDIMPSAWSVTVRNTVSHLSSFSSSLRTSLSSWTASHSDSSVACFRSIPAISFVEPFPDTVGVAEHCKKGSKVSLIFLMPFSTEPRRSSRVMSDWSMIPVVAVLSPDDWDLCRSSWISVVSVRGGSFSRKGEHAFTKDASLYIWYRVRNLCHMRRNC